MHQIKATTHKLRVKVRLDGVTYTKQFEAEDDEQSGSHTVVPIDLGSEYTVMDHDVVLEVAALDDAGNVVEVL